MYRLSLILLIAGAWPTMHAEVPDSVQCELPDSLQIELPELFDFDSELDELTVTARKPIIQSDGATLTYNVDEDPSAATNTTLEMLRKVPMVTVDADDNIKIKGQSNFKIYVNGREDPMMSADSKNVLKSMPASSIKKIEVITEPGAKYDAEGVGGILNIITTSKSSVEGYNGNINLYGGNAYLGGSVYALTKINKVTASLSSSYFNSGIALTDITRTTEIAYSDGDLAMQRFSSLIPPVKNRNWNSNLNLSWEPDTLNLFTLTGYFGNYSGNYNENQNADALGRNLSPMWNYKKSASSHFSGLWTGFTASYQHNFDNKGHNLTLSYQFTAGNNKSTAKNGYIQVEGYYFAEPADGTHDKSTNSTHTAQIDYTLPLRREGHILEAGAKANWYPESSRKETLYGPDLWNLIVYEPSVIRVTRINDVLAAYLSYGAKFGNFNAKAGIRYEHTRLGLRYKQGDYPDYTTRLNDLIPNAALSYQFTAASSLRLAYQMRISRPSASNLNPYIDDTTPAIVKFGNPNLKSSRFNNINLSYSNYGLKFGGSVSVGYSQNDNSIEEYYFMTDQLLNVTPMNIGHNRRWSLDVNGNWTIVKDLRFTLYGSVNHQEFYANLGSQGKMSNSGWGANFSASVDYTTPFKLRISGFAGAGTKGLILQGSGSAWDYHGFSFSRSFLKEERLTVSLNAQNIFHPHRSWRSEVSSPGMVLVQNTRVSTWNIGGSVSFRFGGLKASVKQTENRLEEVEKQTSAPGPMTN